MDIENEINQQKFRNEHQKLAIHIIFTGLWLEDKIKNILAQKNITPQQFNVLRILRGSYPKPLSTAEIRKRMLDKMSDVSRIVERLIKRKLITKKPCSSDKRLVDIMINKEGLAFLDQTDLLDEEMDKLLCALSTQEAQQLNLLLDKIRRNS